MSNEPNPLDDLQKGLGLLFRAAKTTVQKLPTDKVETALTSGAREVARAVGMVAQTIDQQILKRPSATTPKPAESTPPPANSGTSDKSP